MESSIMQRCFKQNMSQPSWDFPMKSVSLSGKTDWVQPKATYATAFCFTNSYTTEFGQPIINGSKLQLLMMDKPNSLFAQVVLPKPRALTEAYFFSKAHLFLKIK